MSGVSKEQIARAKEVGIENYILSHEPNNIKKIGNALYLRDHDSLEISNNLWNWHSQGIGGKNVIDYLIKVRGYDFVDAVRHLAGDDYSIAQPRAAPKSKPLGGDTRPPERKPFVLPPRNRENERVIAYLQSRGIDRDIILDCIKHGTLYESATWHNCVFVGRDEQNKARFAAIRGTLGDFKRDADGSNKRFGFCLPPANPQSNTVFVFESPIDLLSYDTLCKLGNIEPCDGWRLSLGGTSMLALQHLIEQQKFKNPVAHCVVCTDRDTAGDLAFSEIAEKLTIKVSRSIPVGKDWNETLQTIRNEVRSMEDVRKDIRFITPDYKTLFTVKDGESIKFTNAFDGETKNLKCRYIDEAHVRLTDKYTNDYHLCEFAEILARNGSTVELIPGQKPTLNILAAKYGESLQDVEIPMSDAAIKKLVGGKYDIEPLYVDGQGINGNYGPRMHDAILRGKDGIAVCGVGGDNNTLTSLHPYWAQKFKRELSPAQRTEPQPKSLLGEISGAKAAVAASRETAERTVPNRAAEAR